MPQIVGHGGAGTILEALRSHRNILVVINEQLMNNHQLELAEKLAEDNYLQFCGVAELLDVLETADLENFKPFPAPNVAGFRDIMNAEMGFD